MTPSDADIVRSAAIVSRYLPGIHDPMGMDTHDLSALVEVVGDLLKLERGRPSDDGVSSHRSRVEDAMRRLHG